MIPTQNWFTGGWNEQAPEFYRLAQLVGENKRPLSPRDVFDLVGKVASQKLFDTNVDTLLRSAVEAGLIGKDDDPATAVADYLLSIEAALGLTGELPLISLRDGAANPASFVGDAIWTGGTTNWLGIRLRQIEQLVNDGAKIGTVVCLSSSRKCGGKPDRRVPLIADNYSVGNEPTEQQLQRRMAQESSLPWNMFYFAELPEVNEAGKPLRLDQQFAYLADSGQARRLRLSQNIFAPATVNSLYQVLEIWRHLNNLVGPFGTIFTSQAKATVRVQMPEQFRSSDQSLFTLPSGTLRLFFELLETGCISV